MGMWPFRRKSNRRQLRGGAETLRSDETMHDAGIQRDPGRHNGAGQISTGPERRRSRRDNHKARKLSKDSKKLQRDPERRRTYSFSPGRNDNIRVPQDSNRPPVPRVPSKHKGTAVRADTEEPELYSVGKRPVRASTQPPETTAEDWPRVPTLHKRSAQDLARRKSSKKRKEEHDREAEIKAMVAFMPTRPATESGTAGRPMKRESKKMHGGLNRNLQNPSSDISLPLAESIHSSLSSKSERQTSYILSAFEILAPRPTIRYSENPRYAPPERSESKKRKVSARIPEETLKAHKRIDDLADDLDASELRELMERDQKRRENKLLAERMKTEKKLARRQEKQRQDESTAVREGTPPPPNMERGVFGRDVIGLGIGTSAVVTSSKRKAPTASGSSGGELPAETFHEDFTSSANKPFYENVNLASEQPTPSLERSEAVIEVAQVGTVGKANISPPASPKAHTRGASSISQMVELGRADKRASPAPAPKALEPVKQASSESSSQPPPHSWTSFFKRNKTKRASTPSSFSNTSRDSMQNSPGPQISYSPMRASSNIPKRTMSRFREDLPELPLSPPDSRVQSPEADEVPPIRTDYQDKKISSRSSADDHRVRSDTPMSGNRLLETTRLRGETPTSGHRSVEAPSPEPTAALSQSLASIDSEGSWLSGRKGGSKRGSAQVPSHKLRDSASSLQRYKEYSESTEELGIAEDEYFSRLTPGPDDHHKISRQSAADASSDEDDGGSLGNRPVSSEKTKWGAVARRPMVVHRESQAPKSREGLLNEFDVDSGSEPPGETPEEMTGNRSSYGFRKDPIEDDEPSIHRASSVDLGKAHARHISAGSARLLELRKSADGRRLSSGHE